MTNDLYQQAKTVFTSLVDLEEVDRTAKLEQLKEENPELESEVRSLLDYHTSQSLVVPPSTPKIRTRSTLSTTYQTNSWKWLRTPLQSLLIGLPLLLIGVGLSYWISTRVQYLLSQSVEKYLNETIDHRVADFNRWKKEKLADALVWSKNPEIVAPIAALVEITRNHSPNNSELPKVLSAAPHGKDLERKLKFLVGSSEVKYAVWDRRLLTICDWDQEEKPEILGEFVTANGASMLTPVLKGEAQLFLPKLGRAVTEGYKVETKKPIVSVILPIEDDSGSVIAALLIRGYGLSDEYAELISSWNNENEENRSEVYLINNRGALLTQSRYESLFEQHEMHYDAMSARKALLVLDPGVDLETSVPQKPPSAWRPTVMANELLKRGERGCNIEGYRNYVGKKVVGVWRWNRDHDIGFAFEMEYADAFSVAELVRNGLLLSCSFFTLGYIAFSVAAAMSTSSKRKLRDISEVGPYQVQELLGEGGMGRVYLAEHALLCRQSAVKVLTNGMDDLSVIGRFEREVQLASQLTHPNTISIYDFGRNQDGLFYYAMEFVNGAHLGQLVEFCGPIEPGRCIYILQQLCRALSEAHSAGVVHRDIKPQNIMVCNRGGEPDFVKLFDYGLVKSFAPRVSHDSSQTRIVVGTPRFMAPERLNSPWLADPRVDVYSVGALAYYLLTAQLPPLVTIEDGMDNQQIGVETLDLPPDVVDFGEILSVCMAVEPSTRPSNMTSLIRELDELSTKFPWSRAESIDWWTKNESKLLLAVKNKRKKLDQSVRI